MGTGEQTTVRGEPRACAARRQIQIGILSSCQAVEPTVKVTVVSRTTRPVVNMVSAYAIQPKCTGTASRWAHGTRRDGGSAAYEKTHTCMYTRRSSRVLARSKVQVA